MATTLKLQVATKALENDETTIKHLRKDLMEAQLKSEEAIGKQVIAADLIQSLRLEVIQLNRRMKDQMNGEDTTHSAPQSAIFQEADNQVDAMMVKKGIQFQSSALQPDPSLSMQPSPTSPSSEPRGANRPTDFQEWKMKKFLWAPDTPAASENHDEGVVSELLRATLYPSPGTGVLRRNTSAIAKQRVQALKHQNEDNSMKKISGNVKTLPSVKSASRKQKKSRASMDMRAHTLNENDFMKEFNATVANTYKDRPKTSQRF